MKKNQREGCRRSLQAVAAMILMGWANLTPAAVKKPAPVITPKSNVLLIIGDDMGVELFSNYVEYFNGTLDSGDDMGILAMPSTTNIGKLANAGVTFVNAWSSPLCSPSRAGLFTGLYSANNHVVNVMDQPIDSAGSVTLPEAISGAGYSSGLFGKWHLGTTHCSRPGPLTEIGVGERRRYLPPLKPAARASRAAGSIFQETDSLQQSFPLSASSKPSCCLIDGVHSPRLSVPFVRIGEPAQLALRKAESRAPKAARGPWRRTLPIDCQGDTGPYADEATRSRESASPH
jgi:hypothetical protein